MLIWIIIAAVISAAITSLFVCKVMNDIYQGLVLKAIDNMFEEITMVTKDTIRESINNRV